MVKKNLLIVSSILVLYGLLVLALQRPQFSDFLNYLVVGEKFNQTSEIPELFKFLQSPLILYVVKNLGISRTNLLPWYLFSFLSLGIIFYLFLRENNNKLGFWLLMVLIGSPLILSLLPYVNTEVIMTPFFIIGTILLTKQLRKNSQSAKSLGSWSLIGLMYAISQLARPIALYFIIMTFIGLLALIILKKRVYLKQFIFPYIWMIIIFVGTSIGLYYECGYGIRMQPKGNGYVILFIGANTKTQGGYSEEDTEIRKKFTDQLKQTKDVSAVRDSLKNLAFNRIKKNFSQNVKFLPFKAFRYLIPFSIHNFLGLNAHRPLELILLILMAITSTVLLIIYLFNFGVYLYFWFSRNDLGVLDEYVVIFTAILGYTILHVSLLEIQPRYNYHISILQVFLFPITWGIMKKIGIQERLLNAFQLLKNWQIFLRRN